MYIKNKDIVKRLVPIAIAAIMCLSALVIMPSGMADDQTGTAKTVDVQLGASSHTIGNLRTDFTRIRMDGFELIRNPGNPLLPHKVVKILVHPDAQLDTVELQGTVGTIRDLGTLDHKIEPAEPWFAPHVDGDVINWDEEEGENIDEDLGLNLNVYESTETYPSEVVRIVGSGQMREWKFVEVEFVPFQWNPSTNQLTKIENVDVQLSYEVSGEGLAEQWIGDDIMDDEARELFYNYGYAKTWYRDEGTGSFQAPGYVIITTNDIESNSANLASFVATKESKGYNVQVITEDDGITLGDEVSIRTWLQNHYIDEDIQFACLIGNPAGDIPMFDEYATDYQPSDYPYADLSAPLNNLDFVPEVYVGRIPYYGSISDLDKILLKTINYITADGSDIDWRKNVFFPVSFPDSSSDASGPEKSIDDYIGAWANVVWKQYQQGAVYSGCDSIYFSQEELRGDQYDTGAPSSDSPEGQECAYDRWVGTGAHGESPLDPPEPTKFGIVEYHGHGSPSYVQVGPNGAGQDGRLWENTFCADLDDDYPSFIYACSCSNNVPTATDNLGYSFLLNGAIGHYGGTDLVWYYPGETKNQVPGSSTGQGIGYEILKRIVAGDGAGKALYRAKAICDKSLLENIFNYNLYGDPSAAIDSYGGGPPAQIEGDFEVDDDKPETWYDFFHTKDITTAIHRAGPGSDIVVWNGFYPENVEIFTDSRDEEQTWGSGVQPLEDSLDITINYKTDITRYTAVAPQDYAPTPGGEPDANAYEGMMTFAFDMDVDGEADFQIQWYNDSGVWKWGYKEVVAGSWESTWSPLPAKYTAVRSGMTYYLEVPTADLGSDYKFGVDCNALALGHGQTFYSTDPAHLWYNGVNYISSDYYVDFAVPDLSETGLVIDKDGLSIHGNYPELKLDPLDNCVIGTTVDITGDGVLLETITVEPKILGEEIALMEDFTGVAYGDIPAGWTSSLDDYGSDEWGAYTYSSPGISPPSMRLAYYYIDGDNAYLDTPTIDMSGATGTLKFTHNIDVWIGSGMSFYVKARPDSTSPWTTLQSWTPTADVTAMEEIELPADVCGSETQIRFEFDGDAWNLNYWYLDDIQIEKSFTDTEVFTSHDAAVTVYNNATVRGNIIQNVEGNCNQTNGNFTIKGVHIYRAAGIAPLTDIVIEDNIIRDIINNPPAEEGGDEPGPGAECEYEICLYDSFGDGWDETPDYGGPNLLDVLVDGTVVLDDIYLATGSGPDCYTFTVEDGSTISTQFTAYGSFPGENSFNIYDSEGNPVVTGWFPYNDGSWSGTATCPSGAFDTRDVVFEDDFEGDNSDWTIVDGDGNLANWQFGSVEPAACDDGGATGIWAYIDDDDAGSGAGPSTDNWLISPTFSGSDMTLTFDGDFEDMANDGELIVYESPDGSTWTEVESWTDDVDPDGFNEYFASNPPLALDDSTTQIAFWYTDDGGWAWGALIDNVLIEGTAGGPGPGSDVYGGGATGVMVQGNLDGPIVHGNDITDIHSKGWCYGIEITPTQPVAGGGGEEPPEPVMCEYEVCLFDTYGDGWDTTYGGPNTLDIYVDGVLVLDGIYLADGTGPECYTFMVEAGKTIEADYTEVGSFPGENEYFIYDSEGNLVVHEGASYAVPNDWSGTAVCPVPYYGGESLDEWLGYCDDSVENAVGLTGDVDTMSMAIELESELLGSYYEEILTQFRVAVGRDGSPNVNALDYDVWISETLPSDPTSAPVYYSGTSNPSQLWHEYAFDMNYDIPASGSVYVGVNFYDLAGYTDYPLGLDETNPDPRGDNVYWTGAAWAHLGDLGLPGSWALEVYAEVDEPEGPDTGGAIPLNVEVTENYLTRIGDGSLFDVWAEPGMKPYPGVMLTIDTYTDSTTGMPFPANASQVLVKGNTFDVGCVKDAYGVINKDEAHVLEASLNFWGMPNGPDEDPVNGEVIDPYTGMTAEGWGSSIFQGGVDLSGGLGLLITGDVAFDPFIGGDVMIDKPMADEITIEAGQVVDFESTGWAYDLSLEEVDVTYEWDFDDGYYSLFEDTNHVFEEAGTYEVQLMMQIIPSDPAKYWGNFQYAFDYVTVNVFAPGEPLSANADGENFGGYETTVGTPVTLYGAASGGSGVYYYSWDFGDGTQQQASSGKPNAVHEYRTEGTYTVTFTVRDLNGNTATDTAEVTVNGIEELTIILGGSIHVAQGDEVDFSATVTGGKSPYTYQWNFGDGIISNEKSPSHIYENSGTYTATLTVTDGNNVQKSKTQTVTVGQVDTSEVEITNVRAGLLLSATVDSDSQVAWAIDVEGNVFFGGHADGTASGITKIRLPFTIGFGTVDITIVAGTASEHYSATMFGPFLFNLQEA